MNKEELEKEAEEWLDKRYLKDMGVRKPCKQAYLAAALPKVKRIAELEMTVGTLRNFSNEQATCIEKLEAQIEKMKCCGNCENGELSAHEEPCRHCQRCFASADVKDQENVKNNWKAIKEIKEK